MAYLPLNYKDKIDVGLSGSLLLNTFSSISPKLLNFDIESYIDRIINNLNYKVMTGSLLSLKAMNSEKMER